MFSEEGDRDWDTYVPSLTFAYKTSVNPSINETPFYLMNGRDPLLPADVLFDNPQLTYGSLNEYRQQLVHRLRTAHALATRNF
jgi:hypothetical protein